MNDRSPRYPVLLLGGLDPSGGAGVGLDRRIADSLSVPSTVVISSLALQSHRSFFALRPFSAVDIESAILQSFPISAVKIGALGSLVNGRLLGAGLVRSRLPSVLDPVLRSSSGGLLLEGRSSSVRALYLETLAPHVSLFTPNLEEASFLLGNPRSKDSEYLALRLTEITGTSILLKGGHASGGQISDLLSTPEGLQSRFLHRRILRTRPGARLRKIRGTGCALSTAIACFLATDRSLDQSCEMAIARLQEWILTCRVRSGFGTLLVQK